MLHATLVYLPAVLEHLTSIKLSFTKPAAEEEEFAQTSDKGRVEKITQKNCNLILTKETQGQASGSFPKLLSREPSTGEDGEGWNLLRRGHFAEVNILKEVTLQGLLRRAALVGVKRQHVVQQVECRRRNAVQRGGNSWVRGCSERGEEPAVRGTSQALPPKFVTT